MGKFMLKYPTLVQACILSFFISSEFTIELNARLIHDHFRRFCWLVRTSVVTEPQKANLTSWTTLTFLLSDAPYRSVFCLIASFELTEDAQLQLSRYRPLRSPRDRHCATRTSMGSIHRSRRPLARPIHRHLLSPRSHDHSSHSSACQHRCHLRHHHTL